MNNYKTESELARIAADEKRSAKCLSTELSSLRAEVERLRKALRNALHTMVTTQDDLASDCGDGQESQMAVFMQDAIDEAREALKGQQ